MPSITVLGRATSSNVQSVMWCAAELGVEVARKDVGGTFGGNDTAEYLAMTPTGLVPTAIIDDEPIFESMAIVRALSARYGDETFWPSDPIARARLDKWAEWGKVAFGAAFIFPIFVPLVRLTPAQRDKAALDRALAAFLPQLAILEAHLGRSEWIGEAFSFADIAPGHVLYRLHELEAEGALALPAHPNVTRYYQALQARPAFAEHVMISYDSLRPKPEG